jgi:hypothetical protein
VVTHLDGYWSNLEEWIEYVRKEWQQRKERKGKQVAEAVR